MPLPSPPTSIVTKSGCRTREESAPKFPRPHTGRVRTLPLPWQDIAIQTARRSPDHRTTYLHEIRRHRDPARPSQHHSHFHVRQLRRQWRCRPSSVRGRRNVSPRCAYSSPAKCFTKPSEVNARWSHRGAAAGPVPDKPSRATSTAARGLAAETTGHGVSPATGLDPPRTSPACRTDEWSLMSSAIPSAVCDFGQNVSKLDRAGDHRPVTRVDIDQLDTCGSS